MGNKGHLGNNTMGCQIWKGQADKQAFTAQLIGVHRFLLLWALHETEDTTFAFQELKVRQVTF